MVCPRQEQTRNCILSQCPDAYFFARINSSAELRFVHLLNHPLTFRPGSAETEKQHHCSEIRHLQLSLCAPWK